MPDSFLKESFLKSKIDALVMIGAAAAVNKQEIVLKAIDSAFKNGASLQEIYEAILQTYLFAGFPAALEGFATFERFLKENQISFKSENYEEFDVNLFKKRGEILCAEIYTSAYDKMRARAKKLSPELNEWMIVEGYGKTLSRGVLKTVQRELIIVGMLAALGWEKQLFSHIRGAMNVGASVKDCENVLKIVSPLSSEFNPELAGKVLKTVSESFRKV